ncbi:hypothetical protein ABER99_20645 [Paenibacillus glucanolyticus]|jgi:hypothetical protein|uniref:Uncharacterized protein n=1 Tax=Paenibacillus glucanolyticus TaxID=59843 RepID=A0A168EW81_9BACL|nr:hypothetical protein [Paenibacillus glucanolyticus]KZS44887.1 hypothetical protein AWU65_02575 [Paenibacillus glucanolyticus]OMF65565.1 hypothetical protein BK142_30610 [Paenibacillus glucanolyticus]
MSRPRPIEVHVNSKGKKHHIFQKLIHADSEYIFIPVDGKLKTDFFNKGLLDGRKKHLPFFTSLSDCESQWAIVIPHQLVNGQLVNRCFAGVLSLEVTYIIRIKEANAFLENVCMTCEYYGSPQCYLKASFDCGVEDRDRYRDGSWLELQKEIRMERKRLAFPV